MLLAKDKGPRVILACCRHFVSSVVGSGWGFDGLDHFTSVQPSSHGTEGWRDDREDRHPLRALGSPGAHRAYAALYRRAVLAAATTQLGRLGGAAMQKLLVFLMRGSLATNSMRARNRR